MSSIVEDVVLKAGKELMRVDKKVEEACRLIGRLLRHAEYAGDERAEGIIQEFRGTLSQVEREALVDGHDREGCTLMGAAEE